MTTQSDPARVHGCAEVWQLRLAQNLSVDPVLLHTGFVHGDEKFAKLQELGVLWPPLSNYHFKIEECSY